MRRALLAIALAAALGTSACTIAGTAVGASIPSYERSEWPSARVELGAQIRVRVRSVGADVARIDEVAGRYGGVHDGLLSVTDESAREHELPVRDVLEVSVRDGSQWKKGLLLGALADTVVVGAVVAFASGADVSVATGR